MAVSTASGLLSTIYEIINAGEMDRPGEVFEADYVDHGDGDAVGVEPLRQQLSAFRAAFPDLRVTLDQVVEDGEFVASRMTMTGTHSEALMGMPATGSRVAVVNVDIARISSDGKAAERWGGLNMFSLLQQLGAIPAPG